ncbi:GNAT family N-acetyltransferase [Marinitoga aeolica]|uniref:GNAT family N-acetyltransferase n=1 Tax=Marinitoga aeolica TaxID=2809031 RepID=A0ABY8PSV1_9BACT|nr:GNAT family protein [Marinitoga aeolica]WGS65719.1 GNAT family N-acetyltransferase [Marinitoga aeolica]
MYTGEKIYLRSYEEYDMDNLKNIMNNYKVREFLSFNVILPFSTEDQKNFFKSIPERRKKNIYDFAIVRKEENDLIGGCVIRNVDFRNSICTAGFFIDERYWGHGYGKEAVILIEKFVFYELNIQKIKLEVISDNIRALKLYKKLGYKIEGTLKKEIFRNGNFFDLILLAKFRE